jgi:Thioesterase-like superfamily
MVLLHVPRVLSTCLRGALLPAKMGATHIYRARVNALLDIDQFLHMNNASYLVHLELARWEMGVATGFATHLGRSGASFVVASAFTRFRKELKAAATFRNPLDRAWCRREVDVVSAAVPRGRCGLAASGSRLVPRRAAQRTRGRLPS